MIHSIYTQIHNADLVSCDKKGTVIKSEPIPLLKTNYLDEFRTELEKAKVRKNLGIADEHSLQWGNISGILEDQKDLINYIESKWIYSNDISEDIIDVKTALDYAIYFISNYKTNDELTNQLVEQMEEVKIQLESFSDYNLENDTNITNILNKLENINEQITNLNKSLLEINVDQNILNWIKSNLGEGLEYSDKINITLSTKEDNAVKFEQGLYVKDFTNDIKNLTDKQSEFENELNGLDVYDTTLSEETTAPITIGGISLGTSVSSLKGKSFVEILDQLIFPTQVRDLVYPTLNYTSIPTLIKVGSPINKPELIFIQGDAGQEIERTDTLIFNGQVTDNYNQLGTYIYQGFVSYEAGEYLIDNKGQITDKRIEAGSLNTELSIATTYPWYSGNIDSILEQELVKFNYNTNPITISMSGKAIIKLPGSNSTIESFKVNGGLGFLDVDMSGWEESTEEQFGITYKVWTKKDEYSAILPHQISFKLSL